MSNLVVSRNPGQRIVVTTESGEQIWIEVDSRCRVSVSAPISMVIDREEVHERKQQFAARAPKIDAENAADEKVISRPMAEIWHGDEHSSDSAPVG